MTKTLYVAPVGVVEAVTTTVGERLCDSPTARYPCKSPSCERYTRCPINKSGNEKDPYKLLRDIYLSRKMLNTTLVTDPRKKTLNVIE